MPASPKLYDRKLLRRLSEFHLWRSREVAEALGVSQRTVQRLWRRYAFEPLKPSKVLSKELLRWLYLERDLTLDEIAARCPFSRSTIAKYLKKFGLLSKHWRLE